MSLCRKVGSTGGFTLIEVALAVLAIGLGLMSIFALFPAGLQNAEDDAIDTRAALFADTVFEGIRGNAAMLTNAADWTSFSTKASNIVGLKTLTTGGGVDQVLFPLSNADLPANYLRYTLVLTPIGGARVSATLEICNGKYGEFVPQNAFYTEFVYMGM